MTHERALDRVSSLINGAVAVLSPKPSLEIVKGLSGDTTCETALGNSSKVTTGKTYLFQGVPVSEHAAVGRQVLARAARVVLEAVGTRAAYDQAIGAVRRTGTISRVGAPQYQEARSAWAACSAVTSARPAVPPPPGPT
jgi:threonine dehydrogenase-like Zn-dependent dehydrogenase